MFREKTPPHRSLPLLTEAKQVSSPAQFKQWKLREFSLTSIKTLRFTNRLPSHKILQVIIHFLARKTWEFLWKLRANKILQTTLLHLGLKRRSNYRCRGDRIVHNGITTNFVCGLQIRDFFCQKYEKEKSSRNRNRFWGFFSEVLFFFKKTDIGEKVHSTFALRKKETFPLWSLTSRLLFAETSNLSNSNQRKTRNCSLFQFETNWTTQNTPTTS